MERKTIKLKIINKKKHNFPSSPARGSRIVPWLVDSWDHRADSAAVVFLGSDPNHSLCFAFLSSSLWLLSPYTGCVAAGSAPINQIKPSRFRFRFKSSPTMHCSKRCRQYRQIPLPIKCRHKTCQCCVRFDASSGKFVKRGVFIRLLYFRGAANATCGNTRQFYRTIFNTTSHHVESSV